MKVVPAPVVHVLMAGRPLCGKFGQPKDWEDHHWWVPIGAREKATCEVCKGMAEELAMRSNPE